MWYVIVFIAGGVVAVYGLYAWFLYSFAKNFKL